MQERFDNLEGASEDPEATLVTPRFDAEEARRAEPVVPLAETRARIPYVDAGGRRRAPRRSWPTALIAVVMLAAVATAGVVATKVMRRSYPTAPAETQAAPEQTEGAPAQTQAAQAEAAPAPSKTDAAPSKTNDAPRTEETPAATEAPREEARAKRPSRTPRESREREGEAGVLAAPAELQRGDLEDSDDNDGGHHGKDREKRRGHGDDDAEKELRRALKRASKGKGARLIDVLTSPRHE